jgi:NTP pyrophosphatase (non-canonical NTP hydrolase)
MTNEEHTMKQTAEVIARKLENVREMITSEPPLYTDAQVRPIALILKERLRQTAQWGEQNHDLPTWLCILTEEVGELSEAILHQKFGGPAAENVVKETVQIAAVALQMLEFLLRPKTEEATK